MAGPGIRVTRSGVSLAAVVTGGWLAGWPLAGDISTVRLSKRAGMHKGGRGAASSLLLDAASSWATSGCLDLRGARASLREKRSGRS